ncbi:MAG TPA: peptidoglycan DD-metalloendopeptidase family protein [Solirubrobacteraceae bacterium]|jgi:murein DD-endopeptidase MepM/ murein hydrolase activator NlpD|nr:peptidoglycan DD-metalloendopeptidase family protein [Solirubrobacteraceae bacterium]
MRVRLLLVSILLPLVLWAALPLPSSGRTKQEELNSLHNRIDEARKKIGRKKGTERVLTTQIAGYTRRINRLQGKITTLGTRQERIQADLDAKRAELESLRTQLRAERARLVRLRKRFAETRGMLRTRLVEIYKAGKPDLITVVLNSDGFADLIERGEFIKRISDQDRRIVTIVRNAKADSTRSEKRLNRLEARQQTVTEIVQRRRDEIAAVKMELIGTRVGYARTKSGKAAALGKVRNDRQSLENHVDDLEAASSRIAAQLNQVQQSGDFPIRQGSGSMIWPVNGPITGAFGEQRPGHIHAGIDIAAPIGTPIHAADDGRVVLMQGVGASGGYGNYTCVQHSASLSTCYAHQSQFGTSLGAAVSKGQVIGLVGNTGHSFGAHLHFEVRVNGVPVSPLGYL